LLIDNAAFDQDTQVNLRLLYLLHISLEKDKSGKDIPITIIQNLINFLLTNIHKYKDILEMKAESYSFQIPSPYVSDDKAASPAYGTTGLKTADSLKRTGQQITVEPFSEPIKQNQSDPAENTSSA
jgi:hypothetical protein